MQGVDLNEILVFVKVAQSGSFTRAARLLTMPVSTVSARVSSLEKRLGLTLIHRTTRQLRLSDVGQLYYQSCLAGVEEISRAEAGILSMQTEVQGLLKITAPVFLGNTFFPRIVSETFKKFPKLKLDIVLEDRESDLVAEGIDLAIRAGDMRDSSLMQKKIGSVYFAPFASPSFLKNQPSLQHPKDLSEFRCLYFSRLQNDMWDFSNGKSKVSIPIQSELKVDDLGLIKSLCVEGHGVALLPTYICKSEIKKDQLQRVLPAWKSFSKNLYLVYPQHKFLSTKLKAFVGIIENTVDKILKEDN